MLSDNNFTQKVSFPPRDASGRSAATANFVSTLFSPALTVFYGVVLVSSSIEHPLIFLWTFFFMALFVLPPTTYILYLMKKGKVADFHMSIRRERIKPLCVIFVYTLFSIFLYGRAGGPAELVMMGLSGFIAVGFVTLISLYWKVSGHCAAVGGLAAMALHFHDNLVFAVLPVVLLVAWSRIRLGCHSFSQTLAGFALGFTVFFGFFVL